MSWTPVQGRDLALLEDRFNHPVRMNGFEAHLRTPRYYREGALLRLAAPNARMHFIAAGAGRIFERDLFRLDGPAVRIHAGNRAAKIEIRTADEAEEYLRFFCEFMRTDEGRKFRIVDALSPGWTVAGNEAFEVWPLDVRVGGNDLFHARAVVEHAKMLLQAHFHVQSDGLIEMCGDEPIGPLIPRRAS